MAWFEHGTSRIYYEEYGAGDPILLLPGFAGNGEELAALRDALAASYRVIAADLPGSGRSQPQPRAYTATYYEDDARSFTALLHHLGVEPAYLFGFSDGGEVALLMGILAPNTVRSIVAWGAAGSLSDPDGQLLGTLADVVDNPIPPLQPFRDYLITAYGESNARAMTQSLAGAYRDIIAAGGDISLSKAGSITCPVLLIVGEHDFFATPALVAQLAARIPSAETIEVEGVGHDVHNARPEWFAQTLLDWLKRHSA
jgi:valacyclovir hydrolase